MLVKEIILKYCNILGCKHITIITRITVNDKGKTFQS
jgi:hypothetical protein